MTIKAGRSVSPREVRGRDREGDPSARLDPSRLPKMLLPSNAKGRGRMGPDYFSMAHALATWAVDAIGNAWLVQVIQDGAFAATGATRALFANGFLSRDKLAGGFLKARIINGGVAGNHTVTGIDTGDELVSVWRQAAVGAQITDLSSEFTITAANTINNGGGTNTTGDKLQVVFLDLTT